MSPSAHHGEPVVLPYPDYARVVKSAIWALLGAVAVECVRNIETCAIKNGGNSPDVVYRGGKPKRRELEPLLGEPLSAWDNPWNIDAEAQKSFLPNPATGMTKRDYYALSVPILEKERVVVIATDPYTDLPDKGASGHYSLYRWTVQDILDAVIPSLGGRRFRGDTPPA